MFVLLKKLNPFYLKKIWKTHRWVFCEKRSKNPKFRKHWTLLFKEELLCMISYSDSSGDIPQELIREFSPGNSQGITNSNSSRYFAKEFFRGFCSDIFPEFSFEVCIQKFLQWFFLRIHSGIFRNPGISLGICTRNFSGKFPAEILPESYLSNFSRDFFFFSKILPKNSSWDFSKEFPGISSWNSKLDFQKKFLRGYR